MSEMLAEALDTTSEEEVITYLNAHPDFFINNPKALINLELAHPQTGKSISLVERQLAVLRSAHERSQSQLNILQSQAEDNEVLLNRLQDLIQTLIDSESIDAALTYLYQALSDDFDAEFISIRLFIEGSDRPEIVSRDDPTIKLLDPIIERKQSLCGTIKLEQRRVLFGDDADQVESSVIIPLCGGKNKGCLGILAIGSKDGGRYHPNMGTLFINHLGSMINHIFIYHLQD